MSTKPETAVSKAIVDKLTAAGFLVIRVHSGSVKVRRGWMHCAPAGTPDLYVAGFGWLEVKTADGDTNPGQDSMHARLVRAGEMVRVVRSPEEALKAVAGGKSRRGQAIE